VTEKAYQVLHPWDIAGHEACHVVVGLTLGLKLDHVQISSPGVKCAGYALFLGGGSQLAYGIMFGAGVVWDRLTGQGFSSDDAKLARRHCPDNATVTTCYRAAAAIIESRRRAHVLVQRALLAADDYRLTGADVRRIIKGE
jgi:hypothetical protein